ncbi:MAG: M10 family metallopeptidase C-terminal domain-containing protein [Nitrosomonas sp.]|nr:M10 family metallopeptidase C-terminal domain-containing protein [Nitrosomonas sp.]
MPSPASSSRVNSINKTGDNRIDPLLFGQRWSSQSISYSFPSQNSSWSTDSATGYGPHNAGGEPWRSSFLPLSESDRPYFKLALQQWANVANVQFNLIAESSDSVGDIRVAYSEIADMGDAEAWSYLPTGIAASGDIWINSTSDSAKVEWIPGDYAFLTVLHEIGHSLGLEHPFDDPSFPAALDTMSTTIMSYSALPGNQNSFFDFYPTTPMPLDIWAIQYIYGANNHYHQEDTVYHYDDTKTYHETIWDSGGNDWISYAGGKEIAIIDLREGEGSYIGNSVFAFDSAQNPDLVENIWIAYNAVIENATGGVNDDLLIGNDHDNVLIGGEGADDLIGRNGNDVLQGEGGIDTALYNGQRNQYAINKTQEGYSLSDSTGAEGSDTLIGVERLEFGDIGLALDLDGNAGQVAKLLGVVFGAGAIDNDVYVNAGLSLLDTGTSLESLASLALDVAGVQNNDALVTLLWRNLFGSEPTQNEKLPYVEMLAQGEITQAALTQIAANTSINQANIGLVGLTQDGIEFAVVA